MKTPLIRLFLLIFIFSQSFFVVAQNKGQDDFEAPTNLYVTPNGIISWDTVYESQNDFMFYRIWMDEIFIDDYIWGNCYYLEENGDWFPLLIPNQIYTIKIAAIYSLGSSDAVYFDFIYLPSGSFQGVENVQIEDFGNDFLFTWNPISSKEDDYECIGTNIYKNDELLMFVPLPDTSFLYENVDPGYFTYCLTRVYTEDGGEHSWDSDSEESCIEAAYNPLPMPTNFYVTPTGIATWDSNDSSQYTPVEYLMYLDGDMIANTNIEFYDYKDPSYPDLIPNQTYLAGVSTAFTQGISEIVYFEFTYLPSGSFQGVEFIQAEGQDNNLLFTWNPISSKNDDYECIGTHIYKNDELLIFVPQPDTSFLYENVGPGFFTYCLTRVYTEDGGEHSWDSDSEENCIEAGYNDLPAPTNLYVTPTGMCTWDTVDETQEDFLGYRLWFDELFLYDLVVNYYDFTAYDNYWAPLTPNQEYNAKVAAQYSSGFSDAVYFDFIYLPSGSFQGVEGVQIEDFGNDLLFTWNPISSKNDDYECIGTNIYKNDELLMFVPQPDTSFLYENVGPGFFTYCLTRVYTEDGGEHSWDSDSEENCLDAGYSESPNPPKELIAFRTGSNQSTAVLNWTPPSIYDNKDLLHYNIYREGELINSEPYFDTIYYDDNIGPEDICYEITAFYSQAGESEPSNVACAMMVWGINELEIKTSIYPNPAASILNIEAEHQIKNIKILNELGQNLMISGDILKQYYQLDISSFENGLYFLAIEFEKGVITKKLIIQK